MALESTVENGVSEGEFERVELANGQINLSKYHVCLIFWDHNSTFVS